MATRWPLLRVAPPSQACKGLRGEAAASPRESAQRPPQVPWAGASPPVRGALAEIPRLQRDARTDGRARVHADKHAKAFWLSLATPSKKCHMAGRSRENSLFLAVFCLARGPEPHSNLERAPRCSTGACRPADLATFVCRISEARVALKWPQETSLLFLFFLGGASVCACRVFAFCAH